MIARSCMLLTWVLSILLCCSRVLAFNCTSAIIFSPAGADLLRKNCRVIHGDVTIGPSNDNSTTQHINLDGVEVIEGSFWNYVVARRDELDDQPYFTLSSSTLTEVKGEVEFGRYPTKLQNLTLPNLKTVNISFEVGWWADDLTYLDVSSLESVSRFVLGAANLTTFRHKSLRNAKTVGLYPTQIDSLDLVSDSRLNLTNVGFQGPFPNLKNINIGFAYAKLCSIDANASLTLGGPSATNMTIGTLSLGGGVSDIKRSTELESISVDKLSLASSISIPHLEVPFDNLRDLTLEQNYETHPVKDITLPPQAVNWTGGFRLRISDAPELNLTSIYRTDDQNNRVQTWYWPTNISSIWISGANISNEFFDPFVAQQNSSLDSIPPPSVLDSFWVLPSANSTGFKCAPFNELSYKGRLPTSKYDFLCSNSTKSSGSAFIRTPSSLHLAGVALGAALWMA
ncbi:hypothetical protein N7508_000652 [Penicillium antarcticum]|uniref:uncharacterized protein n=1 Tax=Penicillium antarcticum TaxID=416450 RepID=UPI002396C4E4|nr:uncharacterized protein N7508_000652 [Penicillium antarcticum]KAJ5320369.1 hypothetical protein N7508_000652 [Penicillium antarcticum]